MPDDTMLPDDDRDLAMARRLGTLLDRRVPLDRAAEDAPPQDKAVYQTLTSFKQAQDAAPATPPEALSERVWATLEARIARDHLPAAPRPTLRRMYALAATRTTRTWLAAASLLLAVAVGWLLWSRTPSPVLVASAGLDIVTYTTGDGSTVRLRPHSRLYTLDDRTARYRLDGEAFFAVTKDETRTFSVEAGNALISVLGTRFNVSTWGDQTTVYLEEGRVRLTHGAAQAGIELTPGQHSALTADGRLTDPTPADDREYLDWLRQEMAFDRRPLRRVLDELAHHYRVRFDVPAPLDSETISGRLLLERVDQSLDDLGSILGGRFVQVDDATYRFLAE